MAAVVAPDPKDFDVSLKHGFLLPFPLRELPSYFAPWNDLARKLPELVKDKAVREAVKQLPLLDHRRLDDVRELQCAHVLLSFIVQAFVWQEGDLDIVLVLPRQLSVPYCAVSQRLGLKAIVLHTSFVLANWTMCDNSGPFNMSNIQTICTMYPKDQWDWFILVTWGVEMEFSPAIKVISDILQLVQNDDIDGVGDCLTKLKTILSKMTQAMSCMHENLDCDVFYNQVRPFLAGWGGETSPLPNGLIYEGVSEIPVKLTGGSAAQSCTVQCLDALLGIKHESDKEEFLRAMRGYMLPKHAAYIAAIAKASSLKEYVFSRQNLSLRQQYNGVIKALQDFRSYHIQIVTKYIIGPSSRNSNTSYKSVSQKGTGGTALLPFLKSLRDSTDVPIQD